MHRLLLRTRAIAVVLCAALIFVPAHHAAAEDQEVLDKLRIPLNWLDPFGWLYLIYRFVQNRGEGSQVVVLRAAGDPSVGPTATFVTQNYDATLDPGEPNPGGLMTRTVWSGGVLPKASRIVVHTFGSDMDTVIAAYRGSTFASMVRVASNDNKPVPAISTTQSLIQFNVAANTPYRVQIGGRNGAEGDINATVSVFPPTGGLSAFLAIYEGGDSAEGRSYICEIMYGSANHCWPATFVVHNSTNQTLTVTPTTSLGGALTNPAPFTLAPGQAKTAVFAYNSAFNKTAFRTIAGSFTFTGRVGSTIVSRAYSPGLIVVKSQSGYGPNVLRASVPYQVRAARINEAIPFNVRLYNTGTQAATGCHSRTEVGSRLQTTWQEYDPSIPGTTIPETVGAPNTPVTIPAGGFKWLRVWVASQGPRVAVTPDFLGEIIIDCANTAELAFNTANRFDLTAFSSFELRDVEVSAVSPTNGVLNVPASGLAKYRVSVVNRGPAAQMRVNGFYSAPFNDPANSKFVVTGICAANVAGTCIGPTDGVLVYNAPTNVKKYFNVFVRAPSTNPAYDPGNRRVFLNVRQEAPDNVNTDYVLVGTRGIAVKKL